MMIYLSNNLGREIAGLIRCRHRFNPRRQDRPPIHRNLPRSSLIGEENHVIKTFVDMSEDTEDQLKGGSRLSMMAFSGMLDAQCEQAVAVRSVPSDFCM